MSQDAWYQVEIDWGESGSQIATLYNLDGTQLAQLSMSDSTWSSGGIGYAASLSTSGGAAYFDHVLIDGLSDKHRSLRNSHGQIADVKVESLAANGYDWRKRVSVGFEDDHTYKKEIAHTTDNRFRVNDDVSVFW